MKIAVVSAVSPLPADAGNRVRIAALCAGIEQLGHELHFIHMPSFGVADDYRAALSARFGMRLRWLAADPTSRPAGRHMLRHLERAGRWLQRPFHGRPPRREHLDDRFDDRHLAALRALDAAERFDAVLVEYVFSSKALEAFRPGVLRLIDTHDVFAERNELLRRQGSGASWFSCSQADEDRGLRRADVVLAIQRDDAATFSGRLGPDGPRVETLSHLIVPRPLALMPRSAGCFLAHKSPLNVQACREFIGLILPLIRSARPDFTFHVAGAVSEQIAEGEGIVRHGPVADLAPLFELAPLLINPARTGTGISIKTLDAMAHGVPVVSSRTSARGFSEDDAQGMWMVEDGDAQGFARAVLGLVNDDAAWAEARQRQIDVAHRWSRQQMATLERVLAGG